MINRGEFAFLSPHVPERRSRLPLGNLIPVVSRPYAEPRRGTGIMTIKNVEMKSTYDRGLAEVRALLQALEPVPPYRHLLSSRSVRARDAHRFAGEPIVAPAICTREGDLYRCHAGLSSAGMMVLHNEYMDAGSYPLSLNSGLFFSEALSPGNDHADQYLRLVTRSLDLVSEALDSRGRLAFEHINEVGRRIQHLDAEFARRKINQPEDQLHCCYGPNPAHPYSKIALCRTTVPVVVADRTVPFLFEKFLISYSYFDEYGKRRSTVTPVHSHPLNFETVYFTSYGPGSLATEQEFRFIFDNDRLLIGEDGRLNPAFVRQARGEHLGSLTLVPAEVYEIRAGSKPVMLPAFDADSVLGKAELIDITDGLFRPHQVTIHDDPSYGQKTLYYALDNYLGPKGRVLLFAGDGRVNLWSYSDWR